MRRTVLGKSKAWGAIVSGESPNGADGPPPKENGDCDLSVERCEVLERCLETMFELPIHPLRNHATDRFRWTPRTSLTTTRYFGAHMLAKNALAPSSICAGVRSCLWVAMDQT